MDEQKIAAEVAKRIPRDEPPTPEPVGADSPVGEPEEKGYVSRLDSGQFNSLLEDYFDVSKMDRYNDDVKSSIRSIQNWAYETTNSEDHEKALYAIRSLENEVGATFKPDRLARLAKFIRLKQQSKVLDIQLEAVKESA